MAHWVLPARPVFSLVISPRIGPRIAVDLFVELYTVYVNEMLIKVLSKCRNTFGLRRRSEIACNRRGQRSASPSGRILLVDAE